MRSRLAAVLALGAVVALAAACGGGGSGGDAKAQTEVPENAIALVGDTPVLRADFDRFFTQAEAAYEAQQREFPKVGTPEYEQLKGEAIDLLLKRVEFAQEAELLGITVTDEEVQKRLDELKDQFFQGDETAYQEELKKAGVTEADVRANLEADLVSQKIFDEVTKAVTVSDEAVQKYYDDNKGQFTTAENREVAHILVDTKAKADAIYQQLQDGADFAKLAKKESTDTTSGKDGGKLTARKGELVAPFENVAFELKTGEISQPVETQFGWHVIKALSDTKPEVVTPFADVKDTIREQLLQEAKSKVMTEWVTQARAKYAGQVVYAVGFEPPAGSTTPTGTTDTGP